MKKIILIVLVLFIYVSSGKCASASIATKSFLLLQESNLIRSCYCKERSLSTDSFFGVIPDGGIPLRSITLHCESDTDKDQNNYFSKSRSTISHKILT